MAKAKEKTKKKKLSKKAKAEAEGLNEAPQKPPRERGSILIAMLKTLFAILAVAELALLLFIGLRYAQSHLFGSAAADPAVDAVDPAPPVQTAANSASYIGPGLYIKDGVVIYDYTGVTGQIKGVTADTGAAG